MEYNFEEIEKKWQTYWKHKSTFTANLNTDKKTYYAETLLNAHKELEKWSSYDFKLLVEQKTNIMVQINGKIRDKLLVSTNSSEDHVKELVLNSKKVLPHIKDKTIFIKNKILNLVIK